MKSVKTIKSNIKNAKEKTSNHFEKSINVLNSVNVSINDNKIIVKGPKGTIEYIFNYPRLKLSMEGDKLFFRCEHYTRHEKRMYGTLKAHVNNMMKGVIEPYVYKLKICSAHFPMGVEYKNNEFSIKNFLGEKTPRVCKIDSDVDVKINGEFVEVKSPSKEKAGTNASKIELLARVTGRDKRVYQDGIYMIDKGGKIIE